MSRIVVSIDPGLTGAIAWLTRPFGADNGPGPVQLLAVHDIPTAKAKQGKTIKSHLLLPTLADLLRFGPPEFGGALPPPLVVVIEEVGAMPGQGVTSMFRFGHTAGALAGISAGLDYPTSFMRPQRWQALAQVRKGDDAGRLRALQLWPKRSDLFGRKMDHNRADAALIGYGFLCELAGVPLTTM